MVETGFTRAKNAAHTMTMNFMVYGIGMLGYWICGYALQMGGVGAVAVLGGTAPLNHEFTVNLFGHPFGLFGLNRIPFHWERVLGVVLLAVGAAVAWARAGRKAAAPA